MARSLLLLFGLTLFLQSPSFGQVQVYEEDQEGWLTRVGADTTLIDFESVEGSLSTALTGSEFSNYPGFPFISLISGTGIYVGNPAPGQIPNPPSGTNMLGPGNAGSIEGILQFSFEKPVLAFGLTFIDVEADFASTGLSLDAEATLPEIPFTSNKGQGTFAFLGFVSETPVTSVYVHFATGGNIDGVLVDDAVYAFATSTSNEKIETVELAAAHQVVAYPNPFANQLNINVSADRTEYTRVEVWDLLGREVARLHDGMLSKGKHTFRLKNTTLPRGMYIIRVRGTQHLITRNVTLIR